VAFLFVDKSPRMPNIPLPVAGEAMRMAEAVVGTSVSES
jgi:hypothetical protein